MTIKNSPLEEETKKLIQKELKKFFFDAAIITALISIIFNFILINVKIPTSSMQPTIKQGSFVLGNRLAFLNTGPRRGDIIIFKHPDNIKRILIKRVIALPGEDIRIENGKIYINDVFLNEPYLQTKMNSSETKEFTVPQNSYFVMGDNRNDSYDSRYWNNTYVTKPFILAKYAIKLN